MRPRNLVKISNAIGIVSIVLLLYWVFAFISMEVFGLKIFRENITETFYMSIFGILALMFGALIMNVMFNLTRIAEKHDASTNPDPGGTTSKRSMWMLLLSFPLLFGLLLAGDLLTSRKKEKLLVESARSVIESNSEKAERIANYSFDEKWLAQTDKDLDLLSSIDENFPSINVIVRDTIDNSSVLLNFRSYYRDEDDPVLPEKRTYLLETTKVERDYLNRVFDQAEKGIRFSAHNGNYELFYPYMSKGRVIVLYLSDYQRYGKIGS